MKVIDLLNKIANGEIPKTIVYDERYFIYDDKRQNYFAYDDSEIDWKYTIMEYINDEIEIIEDTSKEKNKIPEKLGLSSHWFGTFEDEQKYRNKRDDEIAFKINEIIDCLKSKGDK